MHISAQHAPESHTVDVPIPLLRTSQVAFHAASTSPAMAGPTAAHRAAPVLSAPAAARAADFFASYGHDTAEPLYDTNHAQETTFVTLHSPVVATASHSATPTSAQARFHVACCPEGELGAAAQPSTRSASKARTACGSAGFFMLNTGAHAPPFIHVRFYASFALRFLGRTSSSSSDDSGSSAGVSRPTASHPHASRSAGLAAELR